LAKPPARDTGDTVSEGTLVAARAKFRTTITGAREPAVPPEAPPAELRLIKYNAPPGKLAAYVTPDPGDKRKHPAIIWITGGDTNSIGDVWSPADPSNDQTARQYRDAGIVTMYPSQRGGNDNPGWREGFYGEVDDVLAAAKFLREQTYVDPKQIYLGGHSTGGTLVLLIAAAAPKEVFRAVFAFGPVHDVSTYGSPNEFCPFDMTNPIELELRAPRRWNNTIATPTFVLEGTGRGNIQPLRLMKNASTNPLLTFIEVPGQNHFTVLSPINRLIASRIAGAWSTGFVQLSEQDVSAAARKP
jgi:dipeptidyl aminopeptidase/acylaminoacyl peptidase